MERVVPERLQMDFAALLQHQVGRVGPQLAVEGRVVVAQVVRVAPVARAVLPRPVPQQALVEAGFLGQVGAVPVLAMLEREVAVSAVKAALCLQAQLFLRVVQAARRQAAQVIHPALMEQAVREGVRVAG